MVGGTGMYLQAARGGMTEIATASPARAP
ncbi:MAG: hypothetical protein VX135_03080 [Pseudomonadota bacterium]|nr:hypothetical protein [Pseudomonadota bacterium]